MRRLTTGSEEVRCGYCIATGISVGFTRNRPKGFFEMLRFSPLVSPGKAGMGIVQSGTDTGMLASRSIGHKEARYSLQVG